MSVNPNFYMISPLTPITQPKGSVYLLDVFDNELLSVMNKHLIEQGYFSIRQQGQEFLEKYPSFANLREIRIIPAIAQLLDRQITQFVKVDGDGSFSFFITQVQEGHQYPFLLTDELNVDKTVELILPRLLPLAMLFHEFGQKYRGISGIAPFFYGDKGRGKGSVLCYDSNQDNHLRLPDADFLYRSAYQEFKNQLITHYIPWEARQEIVYWRGSTTGDKKSDSEWRRMNRFQLCQFVTELPHKDLFDIKITRITNRFSSREVIEEIKNSGFVAPYASPIEQINYKYLIDIDGHSSAWMGLFFRLLTGSTVLKVNSERGFRQWFYERLIPWKNYVPIRADFSDLEETVLYLKNHDDVAKKIGEAGRQLAYSMTLEHEINQALPVILKCLEDNQDLEALLCNI